MNLQQAISYLCESLESLRLQDSKAKTEDYDYVRGPMTNSLSHDGPRPPKRARLSAVAKGDTIIDSASHIFNQIHGLVSVEESSDLDGLNQCAVYVMNHCYRYPNANLSKQFLSKAV